MPNQKLSAGTLASALTASDRFPLSQSSTDRAATIAQILNYVEDQTYPRMISGNLTFSPVQSLGAAGFAVVIGTYHAIPFRVRPGDTINNIALEITVAPTIGGNVRIGLYANDPATRLPVATAGLIYDSGNIAFTTGTFAVSTTPVLVALPVAQVGPDDGTIWVMIQSDTASSMQWRRAGAAYGHNMLIRGVNAGALSSTNADAGLSATGTFGAMPSNPPVLGIGSVPALALHRT